MENDDIEYYQIAIDDLVKDCWYVGRGRNDNIGKWDGQNFLVITEIGSPRRSGEEVPKWVTKPGIKVEPYYTDEYGSFQPFLKIDMGEMLESFGNIAWDKHYGRKIKFKSCITKKSS